MRKKSSPKKQMPMETPRTERTAMVIRCIAHACNARGWRHVRCFADKNIHKSSELAYSFGMKIAENGPQYA